jgi:hypothetical protein
MLPGTFRDRLWDRYCVVHRVDLVMKVAKQEVFKVKSLRSLIFNIRFWRLRRAYARRLKQMRTFG